MTIEARKIELVQKILGIMSPTLLSEIESMIEAQMSIELSHAERKVIDDRLNSHSENPNGGRLWSDLKEELVKK